MMPLLGRVFLFFFLDNKKLHFCLVNHHELDQLKVHFLKQGALTLAL